ncbi:MAG: hypothetical protein ACI4Q4_03835, partial [Oscillospiraceae bacterium]
TESISTCGVSVSGSGQKALDKSAGSGIINSIDCFGYFEIIMNSRSNDFARIDKVVLKESCVEMCCKYERVKEYVG